MVGALLPNPEPEDQTGRPHGRCGIRHAPSQNNHIRQSDPKRPKRHNSNAVVNRTSAPNVASNPEPTSDLTSEYGSRLHWDIARFRAAWEKLLQPARTTQSTSLELSDVLSNEDVYSLLKCSEVDTEWTHLLREGRDEEKSIVYSLMRSAFFLYCLGTPERRALLRSLMNTIQRICPVVILTRGSCRDVVLSLQREAYGDTDVSHGRDTSLLSYVSLVVDVHGHIYDVECGCFRRVGDVVCDGLPGKPKVLSSHLSELLGGDRVFLVDADTETDINVDVDLGVDVQRNVGGNCPELHSQRYKSYRQHWSTCVHVDTHGRSTSAVSTHSVVAGRSGAGIDLRVTSDERTALLAQCSACDRSVNRPGAVVFVWDGVLTRAPMHKTKHATMRRWLGYARDFAAFVRESAVVQACGFLGLATLPVTGECEEPLLVGNTPSWSRHPLVVARPDEFTQFTFGDDVRRAGLWKLFRDLRTAKVPTIVLTRAPLLDAKRTLEQLYLPSTSIRDGGYGSSCGDGRSDGFLSLCTLVVSTTGQVYNPRENEYYTVTNPDMFTSWKVPVGHREIEKDRFCVYLGKAMGHRPVLMVDADVEWGYVNGGDCTGASDQALYVPYTVVAARPPSTRQLHGLLVDTGGVGTGHKESKVEGDCRQHDRDREILEILTLTQDRGCAAVTVSLEHALAQCNPYKVCHATKWPEATDAFAAYLAERRPERA